MGALRRAGVWLGLVEDEDDRGYDDRYRYGDDLLDDEEEIDEVPAPRSRTTSERLSVSERLAASERISASDRSDRSDRSERLSAADRLEASTAGRTSTVRSITRPTTSVSYPTRDNLALAPTSSVRERPQVEEESDDRRYAITTLHPTTYNEARTIGEHFRDGFPVIMNLTEMDESDAKRLVDFAAGLVFGLRGNFERVTNRVFLLSPANVQVTAEDKAKIAEGGFFNQS
ncbi:cell division protein SepF [Dactylosporangium sp. NPDC051541]|uniref:cell division protein SepF n=1 Tax=Dactylosporangium sp. NPDC051541 TaxID=3363977 RepID=UPI00379F778B